jgi:hypothetical protein
LARSPHAINRLPITFIKQGKLAPLALLSQELCLLLPKFIHLLLVFPLFSPLKLSLFFFPLLSVYLRSLASFKLLALPFLLSFIPRPLVSLLFSTPLFLFFPGQLALLFTALSSFFLEIIKDLPFVLLQFFQVHIA